MTCVLVTRPQSAADEFAINLKEKGLDVLFAPMLEYKEVSADFSDVSNYDALIFTSAQAARVFAKNCPAREHVIFTVGNMTAKVAEALGFKNIYSADGNSDDLEKVIKEKVKDTKFLQLCSADTPDSVFEKKVIYKAEFIDDFPDNVVSAFQSGTINAVSLFSVRTAQNFIKLLENNKLDDVTGDIAVVCISDTVAEEIKTFKWGKIYVANNPNAGSLLEKLIAL